MKRNKIILFFELFFSFIKSLFGSSVLFFRHISGQKNVKPLIENKFLDVMNFLLNIGPKSFWKKPTGIKIGRSPATFIHYIFEKEARFKEKK